MGGGFVYFLGVLSGFVKCELDATGPHDSIPSNMNIDAESYN